MLLPQFVQFCYGIAGGIGTDGIIPSLHYAYQAATDDFDSIYNAADQQQALRRLGLTGKLPADDILQLGFNRFMRVTADMMTSNLADFMGSVKQQIVRTYISVMLVVLIVLGSGWIAYIYKLESWLNNTKRIYLILPTKVLQKKCFCEELLQKRADSLKAPLLVISCCIVVCCTA